MASLERVERIPDIHPEGGLMDAATASYPKGKVVLSTMTFS